MAKLTISPADIEGVANIGTTYEIRLVSYPGLSKESFVGNGKGIVSYAKTLTADGQDAVLDLIPNEQITPDSVYSWYVPGQPPKHFTMPDAPATLGDRVTQFLSAPPYQNPQRFNVTFNPSTRVLTFTMQGETGPAENFTVTLPVGGLNATQVATAIGEQVSQEHHALASTLLNDLFTFASPAYKTITNTQSRRVTALDEALVAGAESVLDIEGYDLILFENDDLFNLTASTNSLGNNKRTYDLKIQGRATGDTVAVGRNSANNPLLQFSRTLARKARLRAITPTPLGLQEPAVKTLISQGVSTWAQAGDASSIPLAKIPDPADESIGKDKLEQAVQDVIEDSVQIGGVSTSDTDIDFYSDSGKTAQVQVGPMIDGRVQPWGLQDNNAKIPIGKIPNLTDGLIPATVARTSAIPNVSSWALAGNAGRIPIGKLPATVAQTSAIPNVSAWALNGNATLIPDGKIPAGIARLSGVFSWARAGNSSLIPDGKISSAIARANAIPNVSAWALSGNATLVPDSKFSTNIARTSQVPLNAPSAGKVWGTAMGAASPYAASWIDLPEGGSSQPNTGITRSQATNLIALWARQGNTDAIPDSKLPASITRDTEIEDFAKTASSDKVQTAKLPYASGTADGIITASERGLLYDAIDQDHLHDIPDKFAANLLDADAILLDDSTVTDESGLSQLKELRIDQLREYIHETPNRDQQYNERLNNIEDFEDSLREFETIADDRLVTVSQANDAYAFPNPAVNLPAVESGRHIMVAAHTSSGESFVDAFEIRMQDLDAKTDAVAGADLTDANSLKWVRGRVTFRIGKTSARAILVSASTAAAYYWTIKVSTPNVTAKVDDATATGAGKITEDRVTALANAATPSLTAANVTVSTTNLGGNLTTAADTVQKVIDQVDNLDVTPDASQVAVNTSNLGGNLTTAADTVQKAIDQLDNINLAGGGATVPVPGAGDANQVATAEAAGTVKWEPITAAKTQTVTTKFNGILSASDNNMQKVADTLDDKAQPKSEELDEIIAGILPDEWSISETVEVASVMSSVREPANPENLNFGARNTDNFFRQNLWQVVKMPDSVPVADLGNYRLFIGDSDGTGNSVDPIYLNDATTNRITLLDTVAGFRYYSIAVADKPADQQLFIEEQHLLEAVADKWTPFDRSLLANIPATPKVPTGDAFPANPAVQDEFEILTANTVPGLGLMTAALDSGSGVIGWSAGVGAYGTISTAPKGIYAIGYRSTIDQKISVASTLTTNTVNGLYIRDIDADEDWKLIPLTRASGHFRQGAANAYTIVAGKRYQIRFRNDSPKAYADRNLDVGIYAYSRVSGWVATPGQAAPWARQGRPEPRTLLALTVLKDGPGAGLTVVSSGSDVRTNFTGFNPAFTLTDAVNQIGSINFEMALNISTSSDTQIGFDQSTDHPAQSARLSHWTLSSSARALPNYATNNASSTIEIADADIFRGTTKLGNISLHAAHNALNRLGYLLIWDGDTSGYNFSLSSTLEVIFYHNDGTASGLNEAQTDLRVTTLTEAYGLKATAASTKRSDLATLWNAATAESQRLQGSAIRSNTITPAKTTFQNRILPNVSAANANQVAQVNSAGVWTTGNLPAAGLNQSQVDGRANARVNALVRTLALKATTDPAFRTALATIMNAATQSGQRFGTAALQDDAVTPAKTSFENRILPAIGTGNAGKIPKINTGGTAYELADDEAGTGGGGSASADVSPHVLLLPATATAGDRVTLVRNYRGVSIRPAERAGFVGASRSNNMALGTFGHMQPNATGRPVYILWKSPYLYLSPGSTSSQTGLFTIAKFTLGNTTYTRPSGGWPLVQLFPGNNTLLARRIPQSTNPFTIDTDIFYSSENSVGFQQFGVVHGYYSFNQIGSSSAYQWERMGDLHTDYGVSISNSNWTKVTRSSAFLVTADIAGIQDEQIEINVATTSGSPTREEFLGQLPGRLLAQDLTGAVAGSATLPNSKLLQFNYNGGKLYIGKTSDRRTPVTRSQIYDVAVLIDSTARGTQTHYVNFRFHHLF